MNEMNLRLAENLGAFLSELSEEIVNGLQECMRSEMLVRQEV